MSIEGADSILVNQDTLSVLTTPVNTTGTTTTYFFISELGQDTLTVSYDSEFFIFFEDCPPAQRLTNFQVVRHTFDSLVVMDTLLTRNNTDHVQIFLD